MAFVQGVEWKQRDSSTNKMARIACRKDIMYWATRKPSVCSRQCSLWSSTLRSVPIWGTGRVWIWYLNPDTIHKGLSFIIRGKSWYSCFPMIVGENHLQVGISPVEWKIPQFNINTLIRIVFYPSNASLGGLLLQRWPSWHVWASWPSAVLFFRL